MENSIFRVTSWLFFGHEQKFEMFILSQKRYSNSCSRTMTQYWCT